MSHTFTTPDHPNNPRNPEGEECVECGADAFIVTQRLETREGRLNQVVTGDALCRKHFREVAGYDENGQLKTDTENE